MPSATLAAGTSLLAPATPVLQAQASAELVKLQRWFASSRSVSTFLRDAASRRP